MTLYYSNPNHYLNSSLCKNLSSLNHLTAVPYRQQQQKQRWVKMDFNVKATNRRNRRKEKEKVVVIMGATGAGKSQLSIDLATRFFPAAEIINSDKMQVYRGLDITTNKIPISDRKSVPHHLLGSIEDDGDDFTPLDYRQIGGSIVSDIVSRRKIPFIVGGSNSFIHSLLVERFDPDINPFNGSHSISSNLRYNCCFILVDISIGTLTEYLDIRVDDMLNDGMFTELSNFYDPSKVDVESGIRNAIGVPEFNKYFERFPPVNSFTGGVTCPNEDEDAARRECYEEAVKSIKVNTCQLAKRQIGKILRLRSSGWDLNRVDATEAFREVMTSFCDKSGSEKWEKGVVEPSVKIIVIKIGIRVVFRFNRFNLILPQFNCS